MLLDHFASHMDVNATIYCGQDREELATIRTKAANNVKRAIVYDRAGTEASSTSRRWPCPSHGSASTPT